MKAALNTLKNKVSRFTVARYLRNQKSENIEISKFKVENSLRTIKTLEMRLRQIWAQVEQGLAQVRHLCGLLPVGMESRL